jgi:hypothetical protein
MEEKNVKPEDEENDPTVASIMDLKRTDNLIRDVLKSDS